MYCVLDLMFVGIRHNKVLNKKEPLQREIHKNVFLVVRFELLTKAQKYLIILHICNIISGR